VWVAFDHEYLRNETRYRRTENGVQTAVCPRETRDVEARQRLRFASSSSLIVGRTRLSTVGDRAFPVAADRIWNSHFCNLHFRCLSSSHASRLISLAFPISVRDHVQCSRSDTCHDGHFNRSCYLLTYLLTHSA